MMGKVIMSGIVPPLVAPISGILASDLAVGSSVFLMENGVAVEYLIVNHGIPSDSSLYDSSCDGLWLLRKDIKEQRPWDSSNNDYANSDIHAYLNGDFFNLFGSIEQAAIKQVKIPYRPGSGTSTNVNKGSNGLSTKVFLLSAYELGRDYNSYAPSDGAKLSYFLSGNGTEACEKRLASHEGANVYCSIRTPCCESTYGGSMLWHVTSTGAVGYPSKVTDVRGIRPALILPSNALFDTNTLILKGVA